jgi:hypothetical protein
VTAAAADGPVAPLPGEPTPMKAEVRAPHPAELQVLQVPSQWILEAVTATSRDQTQGTAGSVAQYELQPGKREGSGDEPPLGGLWRGADETGQHGEHNRPCGANKSALEHKVTSAAHPDKLKPGTNPAAVVTTQRQEEARRVAGAEELPERRSPVEVQQTLHQEEIGREAVAENFPGWRALWSLKTDASGEMRRPIIEAEMEEACGKRDDNGKEKKESCGIGDKHPAGIVASREEWEDFVREVEDKGDEDDPQYATRSQAGHPVPALPGELPTSEMGAREAAFRAEREEGTRAG